MSLLLSEKQQRLISVIRLTCPQNVFNQESADQSALVVVITMCQ